jgi:hypothetical protein
MLWRAIQVGTSLAYVTGAAAIAATIAMTWLVTRYIQAPLAPAPSATADPALAPALPSDGE